MISILDFQQLYKVHFVGNTEEEKNSYFDPVDMSVQNSQLVINLFFHNKKEK